MPLRDHFRPPVESQHSWDELHGGWPAVIVQQLFRILPEGYVAAPGVHLGTAFEIDVSAHEEVDPVDDEKASAENGGVAVAAWAPPKPTLTLEAELPDQDQYEVRVYDARHGRRLVAAIEIISPSNKDRPESRRVFVAKVAALLQRDVCVPSSISLRSANSTSMPTCWSWSGRAIRCSAPSRRRFTRRRYAGASGSAGGRCWTFGSTR